MRPAALILLMAAASLGAPAAGQGITIASTLVVRTAPRADAPEVPALLGGVKATVAPAPGAPGWVRLTGTDGAQLGFARQQDLQAAPARTSLLAGALTGGAAPAPAEPVTAAAEAPRGGGLSAFLQNGGGGAQGGGLRMSALTDGRLAQAQADYAEEQRRLAEIAAAERRAAEAERAAREAEYQARMEMERIEREQQRAEERRSRQAGDAIIANAIRGAALSIGNAMADNARASYARMQAENAQRMAAANQRAAEQRAIAAQADAARARREAAEAAARARQPGMAPTQQQTARIDYLARAQAQQAAESRFQQQQAAAQQAQRAQALAAQRQVAMLGSSSSGGMGAGGMGSGGSSARSSGSGGSSSASVGSPSSGSGGSGASAASVVGMDINYHNVGNGSGTRQVAQLEVGLTVRDVNVNSDKSRICADFRNPLAGTWQGGYRLTARYESQTFARLTVPPGQTKTVCEILPVVKTYYVVLRQDGPPRSRDTVFGIRG